MLLDKGNGGVMGLSTSFRQATGVSVGILALVVGSGLLAADPQAAQAGPSPATIPNPPGSFLVRADLSIPADPFPDHVFTNAAMIDDDYLGENDLCAMSGDDGDSHPFVADTIEIVKAGTYTFRIVNSPGIADPFLAVYSGAVDKASPDTGVLGCNDDIDDNDPPYEDLSDGDLFDDNGYDNYSYPELDTYFSLFEIELQPGTYTIMLATYDDYLDNAGWYAENGDVSTAASGTATATFEYWGPEGGIVGGVGGGGSEFGNEDYLDYLNERVAAETASDLPNTGTSRTVVKLTVAVGCLAAGMALVSVSRRRRLS